jgi:hypothetical protein
VLIDLLDKACAAGMMPNMFWDTEPADTIAYINAQGEERYNLSTGLAENFIAALGNALSKHPKKDLFPSYDELMIRAIKEEAKKEWTQEQRLEARADELRLKFAGLKSNK